MKLTDLSYDIYPHLTSFLPKDDVFCLMNTSKSEFGEIRRKIIYFDLTHLSSFYFITDPCFQAKVLAGVESPMTQIGLKFTSLMNFHSFLPFSAHQVSSFLTLSAEQMVSSLSSVQQIDGLQLSNFESLPYMPNLRSLSLYEMNLRDVVSLGHLVKLRLTGCLYLEDITPLRNIPDLTLKSCLSIKDFSCLGQQRRLELRDCPGLRIVSNLAKVTELILDDYHPDDFIEDWGTLYGVHSLSIHTLKEEFDISKLGGHHSFSFTFGEEGEGRGSIIGIERLRDISHIFLKRCINSDLGCLSQAKSVTLISCSCFSDLSVLRDVPKVSLEKCPVTDLSPLCRTRDLTISKLPLQREISSQNINHHRLLKVMNMDCSCEWDNAKAVEQLIFYSISFKYFQLLRMGNLQEIHFSFCGSLLHLKGLERVPHVNISFCFALETLEGLGKNRSVRLNYCPGIVSVEEIRFVPIVTILKCSNIKNFQVLDKFPA